MYLRSDQQSLWRTHHVLHGQGQVQFVRRRGLPRTGRQMAQGGHAPTGHCHVGPHDGPARAPAPGPHAGAVQGADGVDVARGCAAGETQS